METGDNSNKIIQSLWIGNSLSTMEQMCIRSFLQSGHSFHLYVYENVENIPEGAVLMDANEIIPYSNIFFDSLKLVASFSDWFRYQLLYDKGGWWVDMDVICLKFFNVDNPYCFATEKASMGDDIGITNAVIKAPKKAEFLADILHHIKGIIKEGTEEICWGEFGPALLNNIVKLYDSKQFICPTEVFCPINWYDLNDLITNQNFIFSENSLAVHLWHHLWVKNGLNKDREYAPNSIYEDLKSKFIVDFL